MKEKKKTFAISEDRMFSSVLSQNKDLVKLLVETVLGIKIGEVTHIEPQRVMDFETGIRSFRLDVYFEDSNGDAFDVEMETPRDLNKLHLLPVRAFTYSSGIFHHKYPKGTKFENIRNTYVIFLCLHDPFGDGLAMTKEGQCNMGSSSKEVKHCIQYLYLNCSAKVWNVSDELKALLDYLAGRPHMKTKLTEGLQSVVNRYNKSEDWRKWAMLFEYRLIEEREEAFTKGKMQGKTLGIAEGKKLDQVSMAEKMIRRGDSNEEILALTDCLKQKDLEKLRRKVRLE